MIDYSEKIPNNVNLADDRRLQRALESWQPKYIDWWKSMGPVMYQDSDVYLRTAVDIDAEGWAEYSFVKMPDYRWGIFLSRAEKDRKIGFGEFKGQDVWQQVPGEYRNALRRLIVIQGDTEPASVEQQRHLCLTAPSLYDMRNLFQVNVEEGRHLWAMVYLLDAYFGRDGRDEADAMLERHSGDPDSPRILGAFNEETPDWLSFFMFTYFTDRDGKYQLGSLRESAFDPLSRTCDFMLKEEAHHMFVGASGIGRVVERAVELMKEFDTDDIAAHGGVSLETIQKYINFHYSVTLDLFGAEESSNGADYYAAGLKGRFDEASYDDDHRLVGATALLPKVTGDTITTVEVPALRAVNYDVRVAYSGDAQKGLNRWNRILRDAGVDFEFRLPHEGFNRRVGVFSEVNVSPTGEILTDAEWTARRREFLPTEADRDHVRSLMQPVHERGRVAAWIAPPKAGIHGHDLDYEYVKL